jgi:gamma-glutamyltranspeptidase
LVYETHDGRISQETAAQLKAMGHELSARAVTSHQGDAHSILVDLESRIYHGVADWRTNGLAQGY